MSAQIFLRLVNQSAVAGNILSIFLSFKNLGSAISSLYKEYFGEQDALYWNKRSSGSSQQAGRRSQPHYAFGMDSSSEGFVITRHKVTGRGKLGFKATFKNYSKDDLSDSFKALKS
jgi:hypothetical protein